MADTTLTDIDSDSSKVNSGTAMTMNILSIKGTQKTYVQTPQTPGKSIAQAHLNLLPYGDYMGIDATVLVLSGVIDLKTYTATSGGGTAPANTLSLKLLLQIAKSGHVFKLTDKYSVSGSDFVYRAHSLTGTFPSETLTTVNVMCKMVTYNTSQIGAVEGEKILYTMELVEVRI